VEVDSGDEVGELAADFNRMAAELETRNRSLLETLNELDSSRSLVTGERNFMESVLNSISSAILTFSRMGELISVNANGRQLLGESATTGAHYHAVFAAWPELSDRIDQTVAGRRPFGRAPFSCNGDRGERYFDVGVFPIGEGMEQGVTVTLRDETEKERMREEMTRLDRFASLGKLSAAIAHEIRNPLTGITLLLDDLHDRPDLDGESQEMMAKALAEIERVEKLINALLTYASPPRSEFRQWDLNQLVRDTLLFFRRACEKEGVALESRLQELQPFIFDPEKIRQVLLNLLRNSLNATGRGGTITVTTSLVAGAALLAVGDTGQGISAVDLPLVFEPFFTRTSTGTGLGLSITQRIVEEHHGTIAVTSNEGAGTLITITLPLRQTASE
jgi:signal transduction histidine kinase